MAQDKIEAGYFGIGRKILAQARALIADLKAPRRERLDLEHILRGLEARVRP